MSPPPAGSKDRPLEPKPLPEWLKPAGTDFSATRPTPKPAIPGYPYLIAGACALISGPTGRGRSSLVQVGVYDGAKAGIRSLYLGGEISKEEWDARAYFIAGARGDVITTELRAQLERFGHYERIGNVIEPAKQHTAEWIDAVAQRYDVLIIDPLTEVADMLGLNFQTSAEDYTGFYVPLIQPLVDRGLGVVLIDNVAHDVEKKDRASGTAAKINKADLLFTCRSYEGWRTGLYIENTKRRSVLAPFDIGSEWFFSKDEQAIEPVADADKRSKDAVFEPTYVMQKVSEVVEQDPEGVSKNTIRERVIAKAVTVDKAITALVAREFLEYRKGYYSMKPYREPADDTAEGPRESAESDRVPTESGLGQGVPSPPSPTPSRGDSRDSVRAGASETTERVPDLGDDQGRTPGSNFHTIRDRFSEPAPASENSRASGDASASRNSAEDGQGETLAKDREAPAKPTTADGPKLKLVHSSDLNTSPSMTARLDAESETERRMKARPPRMLRGEDAQFQYISLNGRLIPLTEYHKHVGEAMQG